MKGKERNKKISEAMFTKEQRNHFISRELTFLFYSLQLLCAYPLDENQNNCDAHTIYIDYKSVAKSTFFLSLPS